MAAEEQKQWVEKIRYKIANSNDQQKSEDLIGMKYSIHRIPARMVTSKNYNKYKPQLVSLGPYHNGEEHLKLMEETKYQALVQLLNQSKKDFQDLLDCLKPVVKSLIDAYEGLDEEWQKNEENFLKMLILDGCFVIAVLQKNFSKYPLQDPTYRQQKVVHFIKSDMLLLENQLPFLLIEILTDVFQITDLKGMLQNFFFPEGGLEVIFLGNKNHLLDILRLSLLYGIPGAHVVDICPSNVVHSSVDVVDDNVLGVGGASGDVGPGDHNSSGNDNLIPVIKNSYSATTLSLCNFEFVKSKSDCLTDILLDKYVIHLPAIVVDQSSEVFYLNLVAFEQRYFLVDRPMCSFFLLMAGLLVMPEDAKLLRDSKIIQSHATSNTAVIKIIQDIARGFLFTGNDKFGQLQQQLNDSYMKNKNSSRRKIKTWFTKLNESYLDSPWTITRVIAVTIGLVATLFAAYYSYESYNISKKNSNMLHRFGFLWVKIIKCLDRCLDRGLTSIGSILNSDNAWEI